MAHYVGDACQPLHSSRFHDGRTPGERGVHGHYETDMMNVKRRQVVAGLDRRLRRARPRARITGHRRAAVEVVELMERTVRRLPPERIIDVWTQTPGANRSDDLWTALGRRTLDCIADGCRTLAMLWSSAWAEAGVPSPTVEKLNPDELLEMCLDDDFAPSLYLPELRDARVW
jgi:hypothetical protein